MATVQSIADRSARKCIAAWDHSSIDPPDNLQRFSVREQRSNERRIDRLLMQASQEWERRGSASEHERAILEKRARTAVASLLLRVDDPPVESFLNACGIVGRRFTEIALEFDPDIADADIFQALRNQWVFNSIQDYLGLPVSVTKSSFAYSMLYPYTDNALDRATEEDSHREEFLGWLSQRLQGIRCEPGNAIEQHVSRLLGMIEEEYPRQSFPQVHLGLMAIHAAQARSLSLRGVLPVDGERAYTKVTIDKGGASVLADALLTTGVLTDEVAEAMFVYGVLLQFIDDLQDVQEDSAAGYSTAFTRARNAGELELQTNRLLSFRGWTHAVMLGRAQATGKALCGLISRSCAHLILEAVARQRNCYTRSALDILEPFMPLPLDYFGDLKNHVSRQFKGVSIPRGRVDSGTGACALNEILGQASLRGASLSE
jgi:hypothetical protein